ncbi:Ku protein [Paraburkholderia sp. BL10I2N1]|uniref:Ku protein n=1 Tax=Paraburkholderia sp. BL10I2N1 TaxID=1938796 RepID=UPI0024428478|nr:Ku protein [Paraburkholderia sp. BL10I2N1]
MGQFRPCPRAGAGLSGDEDAAHAFQTCSRSTPIDPIGYKRINQRTGKEVARENIVRGFEYEKGRSVVLSDEEIQAATPEST